MTWTSNDRRKDFLANKKHQTKLIYSQDRIKYKTYRNGMNILYILYNYTQVSSIGIMLPFSQFDLIHSRYFLVLFYDMKFL